MGTFPSSCRLGLWVLTGVLAFSAIPGALASAPCPLPPEISRQLKGKLTASGIEKIGQRYLSSKNYTCAASAFRKALGLDPELPSLAYLLGLSLFSAGRNVEAVAPLERARQLRPDDLNTHLLLGAVLDRIKRIDEAETEWREALVIDPASATALDGLSQDQINQRDYPAVIALLAKASSTGRLSPVQCVNLGIAYSAAARLDEAVRVLRDGLNRNPDSLPIADELAMVLMLRGRDPEAYSVFETAIQKHPNDQATKVLYLHSMVSNNAAKAPSYAKRLLTEYPRQWEVLYLNGVLAAHAGGFQHARDCLQQSISLNPGYWESRTALGNVLARLGDTRGAKEELEKGIALGDESPEAEYPLAMALHALGETDFARRALRRSQELHDEQFKTSMAAGMDRSGDQAMAAGNFSQAAAAYRDALNSDPDEAILHYKLSRALSKLNDAAGEKAELERAIQLDPKLAEAQNQLGYVAARNGDAARAEAFFRAATQAEPSYVAAWINLAAILASEAKWDEAKTAVSHALEVDPDNNAARSLQTDILQAQQGP